MHLDSVTIPEGVKERLQQIVRQQNVAHLWVFASASAPVGLSAAKAFLLDWLGVKTPKREHADLLELKASGKLGIITVASVRLMTEQLSLAPFGDKGRAVLIESADKMLPVAANALLKVLEEPPPRTVIVLVTEQLNRLLPTLLSRAQVIRIPSSTREISPYFSHVQPLLEHTNERFYSELFRVADAVQEMIEKDAASLANDRETTDMSSAAKQELQQEIDGEMAVWKVLQGKKLIEDVHLHLREKKCFPGDKGSLLQQALDGLERGAELRDMIIRYVSVALNKIV